MKANEFRIGNYLYNTEGKIDVVNIQALEYLLKYGDTPFCQVKPIPLTPEILGKIRYLPYPIKIIGTHRVGVELLGCRLPAGYEYLHQLQNVVYALTNEELEMNF